MNKMKSLMMNNKAEGYVDTAVKMIIGIVIGGLLLAGLYTLFNTNILPEITTKVTGMFDYAPKA